MMFKSLVEKQWAERASMITTSHDFSYACGKGFDAYKNRKI